VKLRLSLQRVKRMRKRRRLKSQRKERRKALRKLSLLIQRRRNKRLKTRN
jgi:hypothetical protein